MQMQQAMQTLQRNGVMPGAGTFPGTFPGTAPGAAPLGLDFSTLLSGGGGAGGAPPPGAGSGGTGVTDAATRYAGELAQLRGMGFSDDAASLRALVATQGNVSAAVDRLLLN